jgi:hypothetical protein
MPEPVKGRGLTPSDVVAAVEWTRYANPYRDLGTCIDCTPAGGLHDPAKCPHLDTEIARARGWISEWQRRLDRLEATRARREKP